ncbi:hypothetical protein LJB76_02370 [Clostridia bacterium OttesenSCG-928-O13]|nr:hypothetical protein [Clostridia bacterium OttesenSCG-928-O13]
MNTSIQIPTEKRSATCAAFTQGPAYLDADFALRVKDDRMTGHGVHENDLVYARRLEEGESVENGMLVVVQLFGQASLWAFSRQGETVALRSSTPDQMTMLFEDEEDGEPDIIGKAVAVLHKLV